MGGAVSDMNTPATDALTMLSKRTKVPAEELLTLSAAELHAHAASIGDLDVFVLADRADKMGIAEADVDATVTVRPPAAAAASVFWPVKTAVRKR